MQTEEQIQLQEIEIALYQKFKNRQCDLFYFDGDILSYNEFIDDLAIRAQQFCWDCDIGIDEIEQDQWDEWIDEYELPEERCSCDRGCRHCLGTEW